MYNGHGAEVGRHRINLPSPHPQIPLLHVRHKNLSAALSLIIASMTLNVGVNHSFWKNP